MAETAAHEIIIIRREEDHESEHHSSAWKVAHADFMTAMMAFFLIMWLVSVTDDEVRKGIAQYFNPIKLSEGHTDLKGLNKPGPAPKEGQKKAGHADQASDVFNPLKLSAGHSEQTKLDPAAQQQSGAPAGTAEVDTPEGGAANEVGAGTEAAAAAGAGAAAGMAAGGPAHAAGPAAGQGPDKNVGNGEGKAAAQATGREAGAFSDPYAVLDEIADDYVAEHPQVSDAIAADQRPLGVTGGKIDRDPFDPLYWQVAPTANARTEVGGDDPRTVAEPADGHALDAVAAESGAAPGAPPVPPPGAARAAETPATDAAQLPAAEPQAVPPEANPAPVEALAAEIEDAVNDAVAGTDAPRVSVKATEDGLLINLTDASAFSMFEIGSAVPNGATVVLMSELGKVLAGTAGKVVIRGHTDARPFSSTSTYDNWQLSASRAQMAYYMLVRGGLDEKRVVGIEGRAERLPLDAANPLANENRRIEILVETPR